MKKQEAKIVYIELIVDVYFDISLCFTRDMIRHGFLELIYNFDDERHGKNLKLE